MVVWLGAWDSWTDGNLFIFQETTQCLIGSLSIIGVSCKSELNCSRRHSFYHASQALLNNLSLIKYFIRQKPMCKIWLSFPNAFQSIAIRGVSHLSMKFVHIVMVVIEIVFKSTLFGRLLEKYFQQHTLFSIAFFWTEMLSKQKIVVLAEMVTKICENFSGCILSVFFQGFALHLRWPSSNSPLLSLR